MPDARAPRAAAVDPVAEGLPMTDVTVHRAASHAPDAVVAAREVHAAIASQDSALTILYCSPSYDLDVMGRVLQDLFGDGPVVGCTTAGEIGPAGYAEGSLSGVSIAGPSFDATTTRIEQMAEFETPRGEATARRALSKIRSKERTRSTANMFGFLLVDGLCMQEEALVSSLYRGLGSIQLFGGSAGDGARFHRSAVYHGGAFRSDCAVFTLVYSDVPFYAFRSEHFVATEEKLVVTAADPKNRIISELSGMPAATAYARAIGWGTEELTREAFAMHPLVVMVGEVPYVRSIKQVNDDGSLTFLSAIDEGIVLTVARGGDMLLELENSFAAMRGHIGQPSLVLGCDSVLRRIEARKLSIDARVNEIFAQNKVVGFASYGELFNALHVNQTFTGLAIGEGRAHVVQ